MMTKILFTGTLGMTLCQTLGVLSPHSMAADMGSVWRRFELQRLFLSFLYAGGFSFNFAMHLYMLYDFCKKYEANPFNTGAGGNSADFLWMVIFGMVVIHALNYLVELHFLAEPLLYMIIYVWSRREPDQPIKMFGVGPFKSVYLPWVYMAIRVVMGGSPLSILLGIGAGHFFYFFYEVMPVSHPGINMRWFRTPDFCLKLTELWTGLGIPRGPPPVGTAAHAGYRAAQQQQQPAAGGFPAPGAVRPPGAGVGGPARPGGHVWGQGRTLGTN